MSSGIFEKVYALTQKIPQGHVTTYGTIAKALGIKDIRLVGWALHGNKNPLVPCHRVVNIQGRLAPHYAFGGAGVQKQKLVSEGVTFLSEMRVNLEEHYYPL